MSGNGNETSKRGFALLDKEKQREIARSGGRAAHRKGAAHEFSATEARAAGRKGGLTISANKEHMARIGRSGGKARRGIRANGDGNGNGNGNGNGHRNGDGDGDRMMQSSASLPPMDAVSPPGGNGDGAV